MVRVYSKCLSDVSTSCNLMTNEFSCTFSNEFSHGLMSLDRQKLDDPSIFLYLFLMVKLVARIFEMDKNLFFESQK